MRAVALRPALPSSHNSVPPDGIFAENIQMNRSLPASTSTFLMLNFLLSCGSDTQNDDGRTSLGEDEDAGSVRPAMPSKAETGDSGTKPSDAPCEAASCESLGVLCGTALDGCG